MRVQELADESAARFGRHRAALKEVSARLRQGAAALRAAAARDNRFYAQATQLQRFWKVGARAGQQAVGLGRGARVKGWGLSKRAVDGKHRVKGVTGLQHCAAHHVDEGVIVWGVNRSPLLVPLVTSFVCSCA